MHEGPVREERGVERHERAVAPTRVTREVHAGQVPTRFGPKRNGEAPRRTPPTRSAGVESVGA